jgi:hypothetical protein
LEQLAVALPAQWLVEWRKKDLCPSFRRLNNRQHHRLKLRLMRLALEALALLVRHYHSLQHLDLLLELFRRHSLVTRHQSRLWLLDLR